MVSELETSDSFPEEGQAGAAQPGAPDEVTEACQGASTADDVQPGGTQPADQPGDGQAALAQISDALRQLADSSARYHARAHKREDVIDQLLAEVDRLRRGERRGLLRPLLVHLCRLRDDLLRQARDLPADFDADRARVLLRSYAETVDLLLEENGVVRFAPEPGEAFEPRMHRRVAGEPASDASDAGRVARIRRDGYLDVEADSPIALAEVVVYTAGRPASSGSEPSGQVAGTKDRSEL